MSVVRKIELEVKDNMSKEEEIKIVETLCEAFSKFSNNYLAGLFNKGLLNYVRKSIKNDLHCDIHNDYAILRADFKEAQAKILSLEKRIKGFEQKERELNEQTNKFVYTQSRLQGRIHQLEQDLLLAKARFYDHFFKEAENESN